MTKDETLTLVQGMAAAYPSFKPTDIAYTAKIWHAMLSDQDYRQASIALKNYIRGNPSGFAPSIGQLMQEITKLHDPDLIYGNETEAWALVYKAACDSIYHAEERFNELPELCKRALRTPSALKMIGAEVGDMTVRQSQFLRQYRAERQRMMQEIVTPDMKRPLIADAMPEAEALPYFGCEDATDEQISEREDDIEELRRKWGM